MALKTEGFLQTAKKPKIEEISQITRISISKEEEAEYQQNLDNIIPWFAEMLTLDIKDGIEEVYSTTTQTEGQNGFNDEVNKLGTIDEVLFNVPNKKDNLIIVPKVIEDK